MMPRLGATVPLEFTIPQSVGTRYVRAYVFNLAHTQLDTKDLTDNADGTFTDNTYVMPNLPSIIVNYKAFTDAGYTIQDTNLAGTDVFELESTPPTVEEIVDGVWDELKSSHTSPGSFGDYVDTEISSRASQSSVDAIPTNPLLDDDARLNNLDATISSRAAPGAAMDLIADAVDASSLATSAVNEISADVNSVLTAAHGAGSWQEGSTDCPTVQEIVDGVWDEPIAGHLDAGSTGEALDSASEGSDCPTVEEIAAEVDEVLTADHGAGSWVGGGNGGGDPIVGIIDEDHVVGIIDEDNTITGEVEGC